MNPVPGEQKREQRKRRQGVMRQLGSYERENDENDRNANDQIIVDFVPAVAGICLSAVAWAKADDPGLFLAPQLPNQPRQLDRPRKKADKDRYEIERQKQEIHSK